MWFFLALSLISAQTTGRKGPSSRGGPDRKTGEAAVKSSLTPAQILKRARQESLQGNHQRVILMLRPLLYPAPKFSTEAQEIDALRLLGLSFWFKGDKSNAEQAFSVLLNRRPRFKLDPVVVPLGAIEFFNGIKKRMKEKLEEIQRARQLEELKKRQAEEAARRRRLEKWKKTAPILLKETVRRKSYFVYTLFPFGVGQFQNGNNTRGWVSAGLQAFTGIVSLSAYLYLSVKYPEGIVPKDDKSSAQQLSYLQQGAGAAFFVVWALSSIDAILNFKPESVERSSRFVPRKGRGRKLFASPLEGGGFIGLSGEF